MPGSFKQVQARYGCGERESAGTGASGVEIQDSIPPVRSRLVGMAEDDDLNAIGFGVEVELLEAVQKVERRCGEPHGFRRSKRAGPWLGVHVAADGVDWSDAVELIEDGRIANVAGVEDGL